MLLDQIQDILKFIALNNGFIGFGALYGVAGMVVCVKFYSTGQIEGDSLKDIKSIIELEFWNNPIGVTKKLEAMEEDLLWIDLDDIFPENMFLIDQFPAPLRYPASEELEIIYDYSKDDINEYKYYLKVERQYIEIIKRFWGISPVYILSNMNTELLELLRVHTDEKESFILKSIIDQTKEHNGSLLLYEKFTEIQLLTKLSLREKLESCFVFPNMKMILWINGLICKVYLGDDQYKELVKLISTTHGLYLRKV